MRINKYLAECGVCSRRKADELIAQGHVSVNKRVVKELGLDIVEGKDVVYVDGKKVVKVTHYDYIMFNKPKGCVTTANDASDNKSGRPKTGEQKDVDSTRTGASKTKSTAVKDAVNEQSGAEAAAVKKPRKTVFDYIGNDFSNKRLFPVGRLDYDSEGLLLLTNDGDLTYRLTHPSSEIPKTYIVKIEGEISESDLAVLRKGVVVDGVRYNRCKAKVTGIENNLTRLEVIIFEGKNREIRRMFEAVDKNVVFLKRVAIGDLRLGGVSRGGYRELNEREISYLLKLCEKSASMAIAAADSADE